MKFKPVSEQEHRELIELFHSDMSAATIMKKYNRDYYTIKKIWLTEFHEHQFKLRTSRLCRLHKLGDKNPMSGKDKMNHHNAVEKSKTNGYWTVFAPKWYKGATDGNRVYEHILSYCDYNGMDSIPKGMVIHHLDEDILNNHPDNLIVLSIADHRRIHAWLNKVQRLSRKRVENSVLEAPDTLNMGDDIV